MLLVVVLAGAAACAVISREATPAASSITRTPVPEHAGTVGVREVDSARSGVGVESLPETREHSSLKDGAASSPASPPADFPVSLPGTAIEDPTGQALRAFFDALGRVAVVEPGARAAIVQLGDSHTAADLLSGTVRRGLQRRFGDAGRGFIFPGTPFKHYYQQDVKHGGAGPWTVQNGLKGDAVEPLGLGGIRLTGSSPKAGLYAETCSSCEVDRELTAFEILYWRHPHGGWFQVVIDGEPYRVVDTRSGPLAKDELGSTGYFRVDLPQGPHRLELHPDGERSVDLFGIILERDAPGVSYDALGLNGAWAGTPLRWSWSLAGEQLSHRDPDLLITWYGTNETSLVDFDLRAYSDTYRQLIARLRSFAPDASCLVLGPPDRVVRARRNCPSPETGRDGTPMSVPAGCEWAPPPILDQIIEIQRAVATGEGCAFWDTRRVMGGAGAIEAWAEALPPLARPDRVHLTREGYEQVGTALLNDLMAEYDRYSSWKERESAPVGGELSGGSPQGTRDRLSGDRDAVQQR